MPACGCRPCCLVSPMPVARYPPFLVRDLMARRVSAASHWRAARPTRGAALVAGRNRPRVPDMTAVEKCSTVTSG